MSNSHLIMPSETVGEVKMAMLQRMWQALRERNPHTSNAYWQIHTALYDRFYDEFYTNGIAATLFAPPKEAVPKQGSPSSGIYDLDGQEFQYVTHYFIYGIPGCYQPAYHFMATLADLDRRYPWEIVLTHGLEMFVRTGHYRGEGSIQWE